MLNRYLQIYSTNFCKYTFKNRDGTSYVLLRNAEYKAASNI